MRASGHGALYCFKICASGANLMTTQNISDSEIPPAKETVSQCHSEALAEESVLCNVLNA